MHDVGELEALIDRVYEPTRRYALRRASPDEAEDAVSETMLLLWQQPERIPKGSEVDGPLGSAARSSPTCAGSAFDASPSLVDS